MKASKFVEQYRKLEDHASELETVAEDYKSRADEDRWEQCRLAYEAVESGEFTQRSFAEAVAKGQTTVSIQCRMWKQWGEYARTQRPTYWEAQAAIRNHSTGEERTREIAKAGVRKLPPEDKRETFRQLAADPDVTDDLETRVTVTRSLSQAEGRQRHQTEREDQSRTKGLRIATELMQGISLMADLEDKAARVGRIWREHSDRWSAEERETFRESWAEVVAEIGHTSRSLAADGGIDAEFAALVQQEG